MTVLVVDDREENRAILRAKLAAEGYSALEATNGFDALKRLRANSVDLVVTDLMMPGMDGYQLTHSIKTDPDLKRLPIIVYTSTYIDKQDEALALNLSASAFLVRPAADEDFFGTLRKVLAQATDGKLVWRTPSGEETEYLRQYTERLIRKLEDKVDELDQTQRNLRDLNATLERRVAEATAQLRQANQDLEAFAYSVSHDLRAPLRAIDGYVSAVAEAEPPLPSAEQKDYLSRASRLATQAQALINEVLEFARLNAESVNLEPVSLQAAVSDALDRIDPAQRKSASIDVQLTDERVLGHHATLVQAIQNLISNALKFTKRGEAARIKISQQASDAGWARLSVADNGVGIDAKHHARLFKVFERLHDKKTYPGTGLGLAIVHRALQKMNGRLGFSSAANEGSTFWIELPLAP